MKLIKFEASWCGPCKMLTKTLENIEIPYEVVVVNIDEDLSTPKKYGVRGVPTLVLLNDDKEVVTTHVGSLTAEQFKQKFIS